MGLLIRNLHFMLNKVLYTNSKAEISFVFIKQESIIFVHTVTRGRESPDLPEAAEADCVTFLQHCNVDKAAAGFSGQFLKSTIITVTVTAIEFCLL